MATAVLSDREQWLEERRKFIGGSDAASLFPEDSKYGCPLRLIRDKRGDRPDYERTENEKAILERGNEIEDIVADKFSRDYGFKVRRTPAFVSKSHGFLGVNMDRQIVTATTEQILGFWPNLKLEGECGPGYLECKSSNPFVFKKMISEGVVPDYVFQVQHGIGVRGYKWGCYAVLDMSSFQMLVFPFAAHGNLIDEIQRRASITWGYVEDRTKPLPKPPAFPDGNTRCRSCIYRRSCLGEQALLQMSGEKPDTGYVEDDSYSEVASDLKDVREQIAILEQTEDQIKKVIQSRMTEKGQSKVEIPSCGVRISWAEQKAAMRWDTKALEAEGGTIAREVAFAEWVAESYPGFLAFWNQHRANGHAYHLADSYKHPSAPTRPFKVVTL